MYEVQHTTFQQLATLRLRYLTTLSVAITSDIDERMSMIRCWNDTDSVKPNYSERNLAQYHYVHHKSHMDWPGTEAESPPEPWQSPSSCDKLQFPDGPFDKF